jgi:hypothetical protein
MCKFQAKSSDDGGDIGVLSETDLGTILVNLNAKELVCGTNIHYYVFSREFHVHFNHSLCDSIQFGPGGNVDGSK